MSTLVSHPRQRLWLYFLKLGATCFGGPAALTQAMHEDLVVKRRYVSETQFKTGLALAQLAPGPMAPQVAIYIGWLNGRLWGATLAGLCLVTPSFFMVLILAHLYLRYGNLPWVAKVSYGMSGAIIAIMIKNAAELGRKTLARDRWLWGIFLVAAVVTFLSKNELFWLFMMAGLSVVIVRNKKPMAGITGLAMMPLSFLHGLASTPDSATLTKIFFYFLKVGAMVFGSGLVIVPFLHQGVVQQFHWLNEAQFLDAVAVAMITPGPIVITVAFIGALVAGPLGGALAALGIFLPCYLFVVLPAPFYHRFSENHRIRDFVDGVAAAALGAIFGAALLLANHNLRDLPALLIFLISLMIFFFFKRLPAPWIILGASIAGLLLK